MRFWRRLVGHGKNVNVLGSVAAGIEREVAQLGSAGYRPLWGRRPYGWVTAVGSASRHLVDRHRLVSINQYAARDTHAGVVMAAGVDVTIMPGTGKFDPEDQRWLDQVATLHAALGEEVRPVSRHGVPEPGVKGAVDTVILTLGSSGALTAAVACFRAWLTRDKTRTLTVTWTDGTGVEQTATVTGDNIDQASFQTLAEAIRERLGGC